jgi:small subunit ribosomal protein S4
MHVGDVITIRESARAQKRIEAAIAGAESRPMVSWLEVNRKEFTGKVTGLPVREELNEPSIHEQYIVEYYSR